MLQVGDKLPREYMMWLGIFTATYSYFAFGFDDDPDSCYANESIDKIHRLEGEVVLQKDS